MPAPSNAIGMQLPMTLPPLDFYAVFIDYAVRKRELKLLTKKDT